MSVSCTSVSFRRSCLSLVLIWLFSMQIFFVLLVGLLIVHCDTSHSAYGCVLELKQYIKVLFFLTLIQYICLAKVPNKIHFHSKHNWILNFFLFPLDYKLWKVNYTHNLMLSRSCTKFVSSPADLYPSLCSQNQIMQISKHVHCYTQITLLSGIHKLW